MTNKRRPFFYSAQDQYIDQVLEAQRKELQELRKEPTEQVDSPDYVQRAQIAEEELSFSEKLHLIGGAIGAGLAVAAIFLVAFALFILFCTKVWFA